MATIQTAAQALERFKLPIPDEAGTAAYGELLRAAWESGGMGGYAGAALDALRDGAANLDPILDAIPMDAAPVFGAIFDQAFKAIGWQRDRDVMEGYAAMCRGFDKMVFAPGWSSGSSSEVAVEQWTDCRDTANARRRPTVTPQKVRAPWRNPGPFRQPSGNCGKGLAVWCGGGMGNRRKPGADGDRCRGYADTSVLLYPYWCAALPPGPAPEYTATVNDGVLPKPSQGGPPYIALNAAIATAQGDMLADLRSNFRVSLARVVEIRERLASLAVTMPVLGPYRMQLAVPEQSWNVPGSALAGSIAACDAFLSARAALTRTEAARDLVRSSKKIGAFGIDRAAIKETEQAAKEPPKTGAPTGKRPPRARDVLQDKPPASGGGLLAAGALGVAGAAWWLLRKKG